MCIAQFSQISNKQLNNLTSLVGVLAAGNWLEEAVIFQQGNFLMFNTHSISK